MTQDDIVVMAVNAGANAHFVKHHIAFIEKLAKLVAAKEREACALICDAEQKKNEDRGQWMWEAKLCGIAIRARSEA